MPMETYKKVSIAVIVLSVAAIVVIAAITSNKKTEVPAAENVQAPAPAGPMLGAELLKDASAFPDDPKELALIGDTFFENQNYGQAVVIYEKTLKLDSNDIDTHNDLSLAYFYTGRPEEAIATVTKGIELDPTVQRIWLSKGFMLFSMKQNEEAKQALQKAHELDPDSIIGKEAKRMIGQMK